MTPKQKQIVADARATLGMRWSHQARGRDGKTDCAGVVLMAARAQGRIPIDVPTDYDREAPPEAMADFCRKVFVEIARDELAPGDIVVLRYPTTNHIGVIGDYPIEGHVSIIHAQATHPRCVVENRLDDEWLRVVKARIVACFRFPEVLE